VLETPILLTNTFGGGHLRQCADPPRHRRQARKSAADRHGEPVVLECNDGYLNDIQAMAVTEAHANAALDARPRNFAFRGVGAGAA